MTVPPVPLYVVAEKEGIPIPHTTYLWDVPMKHAENFITQDHDGESLFVLGIIRTGEPWEVLDDIKILATQVARIGVLCSLDRIESNDDFLLAHLHIVKRVFINDLELGHNFENQETIYVDVESVPEDFLPAEEDIIEDLGRLMNLFGQNPAIFTPELTSAVEDARFLVSKMDIAAGYLLRDEARRLRYVQSEDQIERFNLVALAVKNFVESNPNERKKTQRTRLATVRKRPAGKNLSIKEKFERAVLPDEIREQIQREVEKLDTLPNTSTEHSLVTDYLTWICDIPWGVNSYKDYKLIDLVKMLGKTHYGLLDVKQHILEHLTIEQVRGGSAGSVLCFLGPPGTGKTSIAKEIAEVSGRKLVRIALGGLSDEAEIRGHRRTYVASRPGRFVIGLKTSGAMDPLFVLDEVDKISNTSRGDPTAALLEILDPEQNDHFVDRYLEVPVNLSRAMFICTANYKEQIPEALRDRMEFITFREYDKEERLVITKNFLLPKCLKEYQLESFPIEFTDEAIDLISDTTQVRQIEKHIRKLLRMAAVELVVYEKTEVKIDFEFVKTANIKSMQLKANVGFKTRR
jgi:ATP-dependent Lon protease